MPFLKSQNIPFVIKVWVIFLLFACINCFQLTITSDIAFAANRKQKIEDFKHRQYKIELKRRQTRQKIEQIKKQENKALKELKSTQYKLEMANVSLRDQQYRLGHAKNQLDKLESNLLKLNNDQQKLKAEAAKRIRQIYKGERLSLLHMLVGVKDISTFLDRIYYQQRMIKRDKEVLDRLRQKTVELIKIKDNLEFQKENIIATINSIENKKKEISIAVNVNRELVSRLKHDRSAYEAAENQLARESRGLEATIRNLLARTESRISYTTGNFIRPVIGAITSPYGWRRHPIFGGSRFHTGVDIAGPNRTSVRAANSGKVIYTGWYGGYGKVVIIDHGKSITTLYAHMSSIAVGNGQKVSKGEVVGYEGSTGYSTGPHLHFEVRINGRHTNPLGYI